MADDRYILRTVSRALDLLALLERAPQPMTLTELAAALDEAPAVVLRLLRTLEAHGRTVRPGGGKRHAAPAGTDLRAAVRAAAGALRALSRAAPAGLSPAEFAVGAGLDAATATALLEALDEVGFAMPAGGGRWALSPRLLELTRPLLSGDLIARLRPIMERLRDRTGESVGLLVRGGLAQVLVDAAPSRQPLRFASEIGDTWPIHRGAGGRALLMGLDDPAARALLADIAAAGEVFDPAAVLREVAASRSRGWAVSVGERLPGVGAVAAPVRDAGGVCRAVVNVSFPAFRAPEARRADFGRWLADDLAALDPVPACG